MAASETADLVCVGGLQVSVDTSGFAVPPGSQSSVGVRVGCAVPLFGLAPGLPGTVSVRAESRSVLDRYRGRS